MPPSALEQLTRLNINYPMLFKITNKKTNRITHCGVLEFIADEGKVYLPLWVRFYVIIYIVTFCIVYILHNVCKLVYYCQLSNFNL